MGEGCHDGRWVLIESCKDKSLGFYSGPLLKITRLNGRSEDRVNLSTSARGWKGGEDGHQGPLSPASYQEGFITLF